MSGLRLVLVGSGTGIGKTHVGCSLVEAWAVRGVEAVGLKPVETGVIAPMTEPSDQERLRLASELFHVKRQAPPTFHVKQSLYAFPHPVSPHLAARADGTRIDLSSIRRWVGNVSAPVVVIETAGGLFSPLGDGATNLDLVRALEPSTVLLVAPDRLGVLHDLTATLGLAAVRGLCIRGVALSTPADLDASTGSNARELSRLGIANPIAVFPRLAPSDPASRAAASAVIDWVERRGDHSAGERR